MHELTAKQAIHGVIHTVATFALSDKPITKCHGTFQLVRGQLCDEIARLRIEVVIAGVSEFKPG